MSANKPEPPPNQVEGPAIWDLVIVDARERDRQGQEQYGMRLQANNGRCAMVDAYQEVLDLAAYLRQHLEEVAQLRARLAEVEAAAAHREEKLRDALRMSDELASKWAKKYQGSQARLAEVESERDALHSRLDQARLDAGIYAADRDRERRISNGLQDQLDDATHSRDGWKAQAEGLAASSKALEKAMAAELERVAR